VVETGNVCGGVVALHVGLALFTDLHQSPASVVVQGEILQTPAKRLVANAVFVELHALLVHLAGFTKRNFDFDASQFVGRFHEFTVAFATGGVQFAVRVGNAAWAFFADFVALEALLEI
jgi:hypothetical protein